MGRVFGLSHAQVIFSTVLPGALPSILNGVRTALTTSWLALVGAESLGASAGIGFLATNAREFLQTDVMVLVIVLYAIIGILSDPLARLLERRLLAWHPSFARPRGKVIEAHQAEIAWANDHLALSNTVLTPHLGYVTAETYRIFYGQAIEDIQAYLGGTPIRLLSPPDGAGT
jgi:Binding-protein-dependent transport system inner membrane component